MFSVFFFASEVPGGAVWDQGAGAYNGTQHWCGPGAHCQSIGIGNKGKAVFFGCWVSGTFGPRGLLSLADGDVVRHGHMVFYYLFRRLLFWFFPFLFPLRKAPEELSGSSRGRISLANGDFVRHGHMFFYCVLCVSV